jgi:hypothetical protein
VTPNSFDAPGTPTTVGEQVAWATRVLESVGVSAPAREATALLAAVLEASNDDLEADPAAPLAATQVDRFLVAIARRTRGEQPHR